MIKKILLGISAGIISGLFAAGGGMIVVPAFVHIFKLDEAEARATSVFQFCQWLSLVAYFTIIITTLIGTLELNVQ